MHCLLEQRRYLTQCLEAGRLELGNNRSEQSIKPFVMGRKNFLFANTPAGAQFGAVIYSIIETAKKNGLESHRYLLWIFLTATKLLRRDKNWIVMFLPEVTPIGCGVK